MGQQRAQSALIEQGEGCQGKHSSPYRRQPAAPCARSSAANLAMPVGPSRWKWSTGLQAGFDRTGPARRIAMSEKSQWQSQTRLTRDAAHDRAQSADSAPCEDQTDEPFFYANCCLGFFPVGPLDFHAFAKGQLMAMAIFVPAAIALFIFCAS